LNNLERLAEQADRATFLSVLRDHPGALLLLARLCGTSQFLADTLRRHPTLLPWLLEPATMRRWLGDELDYDVSSNLTPSTLHPGRGAGQRAQSLQASPAPSHRLPRHPG